MPPSSQSEVIEEINRRVDPQLLLEKTNFHPDQIVVVGSMLKAFCPIHAETKFKTLLVDLTKGTFKCSYRPCPGHKGGSLIEFFGLYQGIASPLQAGFALLKFLDLDLEESLLHRLSGEFVAEGKRTLDQGRLDEANENVIQALDAEPENVDAHLLASQLAGARGGIGEAVEHAQRAAAIAEGRDDKQAAIRIITEQVLELLPDDEDALLHLTDLHESLDEIDQSVDLLVRVVHARENRGDYTTIIPLLGRILSHQPDRCESRLSLAQAFEASGELDQAAENYLLAVDLQEKNDRPTEALETLHHIREIQPANWTARDRIAQGLLRDGKDEEYLAEVNAMADLAVDKEDVDRAEGYAREVLERDASSLEARETLARILDQRGDLPGVAREYMHLADLYAKQDRPDRVLSALRAARSAAPDDASIRDQLVEKLLSAEEIDEAAKELLDLGHLHLEHGHRDDATAALDRLSEVAPANLDVRMQAVDLLETSGMTDRASEECCQLAETLASAERWSDLLRASERGLGLNAASTDLRRLHIRALRSLDQTGDAVDEYRILIDVLLDQGDDKAAETAIEEALQLEPQHIELQQTLVDIYLRTEHSDEAVLVLRNLTGILQQQEQTDPLIETCERLLELSPEDADTRILLAEQYLKKGLAAEATEEFERVGDYYARDNDYEAALQQYERVFEIDPSALGVLRKTADLALTHDSLEAARPYFERILNAVRGQDDPDALDQEFQAVLERDSSWSELRREYAEWLLGRRRSEDAYNQFIELAEDLADRHEDLAAAALVYLRLIEYEPERIEFHVGLSGLYERQGEMGKAAEAKIKAVELHLADDRKEEALSLLEEIVRLKPSDETLRLRVADQLVDMGRKDGAVEQLQEIAALRRSQDREEENVEVYRRILDLDSARYEVRRSLAEALEAGSLPGEAAEQWLLLADSYQNADRHAEAVSVCRHAIELEPEEPGPRLRLAALFEGAGETAELKEEYDSLVALYHSQGASDEAADILRRMIELDPDDLALPERLGRVMEEKGEARVACALYFDTAQRHRDLGEGAMARALLVRIKTIEPERRESREALAEVCETLEDPRGAAREYLDLVQMAFEGDDLEGAGRYAEQVSRLAGEGWDLIIELAHVCSRHHQNEMAVRHVSAAVEKALQNKDSAGGLKLTGEALRLAPESRSLRERRVEFFLLDDRTEDAVEEYRTLADLASRDNDPEAAALYYQSLLELAPRDISAHRSLAELMMELDDSAEALKELTQVMELETEEGQSEEAIATAGRILEIEPDNSDIRASRVDLCMKAGQTGQATEDLNVLADTAAEAAEWEKAEGYLRRILTLTPDSLDAVRRLGRTILEYRSLEDARPILQRRVELASTLLDANELVAEYEDILRLDPRNPEFHLEFGRLLRDQGDADRAGQSFTAAADLWEEAEDLDRAFEILSELADLRADDFELLKRQGRLLLKLERTDEARDAFVRAGEGLISQEALPEGVGAFLQALQIDPDDEPLLGRVASLYEESEAADQARELYLRLAGLQERRGAPEECVGTYRKLLALSPGDLEIRRRLAQTYETLGKSGEAAEEWLAFAEKAEEQNKIQDAISACLHIKEIDSGAIENRKRLIGYHRGLDDLEAARREVDELADLHEASGDTSAVEALLTDTIAVDPTHRPFRRRLADFHAAQDHVDQAAQVLAALARLCRNEGDPGEAIGAYRRLVDLKPDDFEARASIIEILQTEERMEEAATDALALAQIHLEANSIDKALEWAGKALEFDCDNVDRVVEAADLFRSASRDDEARNLLIGRADAFLDRDMAESADEVIAHALEWYPGDAGLLASRIAIQTALGDAPAALESCKLLAHAHHEAENLKEEEAVWRQALELDPEDVESHEGLIAVLEAQGDERLGDATEALLHLSALHLTAERPRRAIECQRKCLELNPDRNDVRETLAQMLLDIGDWPSALEEYLDLARRHFEAGESQKARAYYEKVLELDHENLDALRILIRLALDAKDHDAHIRYSESLASIYVQGSARNDAIQCYRDLLEFSPDHTEGWETLGSLLEQEERIDEAIEVWNRLAQQYQDASDTYAAIENLQKIEHRRPEDLETARKLAALSAAVDDPATAQRYRRVVELAEQAGDPETAADALERLLEIEGDDPALHRTLARLLKAQDRNEEAVAALEKAATLHEQREENDQVSEVLSELLDIDPDNHEQRERFTRALQSAGENERAFEQFLLLADGYEKLDDLPRATARCRDAIGVDPDTLDAHTRLHRYFTQTQEIPEALEQVNWLADHYTEKEDLDKVREYLESGLALDAQNIGILERLAEMHMKAGQLDEATSRYLRIAEVALVNGDLTRATHAMELARDCSPDDVEIRRNLAEIYVRQGIGDNARTEFFEVARLYLAQGLVADARGTLDALIIQSPKDIELRERIAGLYVDHGIPELAALQFVELARLHKQSNDPNGVLRYTDEALALKPRTIEAKELHVEAQVQLGDLDGAYATYSDLADLYAQTGQPERAADCLRPMIEMKPEESEPRQRLIDLLQRLNRPDAAVEEMRQLASLHAEAGRLDEAVETLRAILETRPDDTRARVAYIQTYSQIGPEQDLVDDYIKLATIFVSHNSVDKATEAYEKALTIAPENKAHREVFIRFLLDSNQAARAEEECATLSAAYLAEGENREAMNLLQKVLKVAPENTDLRLRLAEAHSRLNSRGMALKELRLVAKAYEKAGNKSGLVETYQQILDIDPQNVDTRQDLIELLRQQGRLEEVAEQHMQLADVYVGRGLLDLARDEYRGLTRIRPEDLTAWNYLIATREQLGEEGLGDDYLAVGQIHENIGSEKEALEYYRKAIDSDPVHLEARRQYIETYKKTGKETDLIDDYLALADILVARNHVDEAVEVYSHVMALDPSNETAKKKLVDTQARRAGMAAAASSDGAGSAASPESEATAPSGVPMDLVDTAVPPSAKAPEKPEGEEEPAEISALAEEEAGLEQVVANYQDILQVNPQNANVRLKLADLYEQMGRPEDGMSELVKASEIFFQKSELNMCISICERILERNSSDGKVRERLSKAVLKRDAFKALESAILFSDQASQAENEPKRPSPDPRDTL